MTSISIDAKRLERVRDDFSLLFYRWARLDAEKQAGQGFPLFSLLKDSLAEKYFRVYQALPQKDQLIFLRAMLKRTHSRAVELTREFMTTEEQSLIAQYLNPPWQDDRKELEAGWRRPRLTAHDRTRLTQLVKAQVAKATGGDFEEWAPGLFVFYKVIKPWRISTRVAIKHIQNMGYEHSIVSDANPELRLKEYTSITRWLGIGETNWNLMTPAEVEQCSESVIVLANYFLDSIPDLLAKISQ